MVAHCSHFQYYSSTSSELKQENIMKINLRKLLMWWDEQEQLADVFTEFVLEYAMKAGSDNFVSDYARVLRDSGKFTVPNLADLESLLRHAGLNTEFDGRQTRVNL